MGQLVFVQGFTTSYELKIGEIGDRRRKAQIGGYLHLQLQ